MPHENSLFLAHIKHNLESISQILLSSLSIFSGEARLD